VKSARVISSPGVPRISPNNRMPAIVDHEPRGGGAPVSLFESGRDLRNLAEKTRRFIPGDSPAGPSAQWLFCSRGLGRWPGRTAPTVRARSYRTHRSHTRETNRRTASQPAPGRIASHCGEILHRDIRVIRDRAAPGTCQNLATSSPRALVQRHQAAARTIARIRRKEVYSPQISRCPRRREKFYSADSAQLATPANSRRSQPPMNTPRQYLKPVSVVLLALAWPCGPTSMPIPWCRNCRISGAPAPPRTDRT